MDIEKENIEQENMDQANIDNLKSLWKKYGSTVLSHANLSDNHDYNSVVNINTDWPHRCWFDEQHPINILSWLTRLPTSTMLPVWPAFNKEKHSDKELIESSSIENQLISANWQCSLEQTAMYLSLADHDINPKGDDVQVRTGFVIKKVQTAQELTSWVNVVKEAFGYSIERNVIEKLLHDSELQILTAYYHESAVASAILFKTGDTIGIHQVGVKPSFQGQGLARDLMEALIAICIQWQGKYLVLQASKAGKPLYQGLGFTEQFILKSYQKVSKHYLK